MFRNLGNLSFSSNSDDDDEDFLLDIPEPEPVTNRQGTPDPVEMEGQNQGFSGDEGGEVNGGGGYDEDSLLSIGSEGENVEGVVNEEQEEEAQVTNGPVSGFRVRVGPDGEEVFEFASGSDELSDDDENDDDWHDALGVEPAVEFALPVSIVTSIAQRVNSRQQRRASHVARYRMRAESGSRLGMPSNNQPSTSTGAVTPSSSRRPRKNSPKKAKAKKKPKVQKPRVPPKPLGPLFIEEDWDGNEDHVEYLRKIKKRGYFKVNIAIRNDQQLSQSALRSPRKQSLPQVEVVDTVGVKDVTMEEPRFDHGEKDDTRNSISEDISQVDEAGTDSGISGYKIAELQFDRCSTHIWEWKDKEELLAAHPDVIDLTLYVNEQPGSTILHMRTKRTLIGDAIAERQGPPPKLSRRDSARELAYIVTQHYFYHVDPVGVPFQLFERRGLGNRKMLALDFQRFDAENQCFIIDVVLPDSLIMGEHDISEIPGKKPYLVQEVFANFLGIAAPPDPPEEELRQKEDIDWFYGQIKKYHTQESLPLSDIPIQSPSLKPTLRQYQRDAVNWMLFREGCLDHCVAHSSPFYLNRVNLIQSFLDKMYVPVILTKHQQYRSEDVEVESKSAFYNPYIAYFCWNKPTVPPLPTGGILCDEMGLGKTVETLCLILLNKKPDSDDGIDIPTARDEEEKPSIADSDELFHTEESSDQTSSESDISSRKRKSRKSAKKRKKSKRERNAKVSRGVSFNLVRRSRRRATSPCEFTTTTDDTGRSELVAIKPVSSPRRRRSTSSQQTVLEAVDEKLAEVKASKLKRKEGTGSNEEQAKPLRTFDALKILYDSALNNYKYAEMAKSTPKFHGKFYETYIEAREFFECICGESEDYSYAKIVKCSVCCSSQHAECVGYDASAKKFCRQLGRGYLCPHCEALEAPVETKSTLIITPQSISHQWIKEIQRHVQNNSLKMLFYKGVAVHGYIPPAKLSSYDLVITTYNVLSTELDYVDLPHCNSSDGRRFRNPKRFLTIPSPLPSILWWRVCLDEAQMVEGIATKMSTMARRLQAVHRWCVTGTPVHKGLQDLFGLFVFLQMSPINYDLWWNVLVRDAFLRKETSLLYELFGQMIWRNGKKDVLDQLGIPPQTEVFHWLNFSPVETHFYKQQFEIASQKIFEKIQRLQSPETDILSLRLTSLDRSTLNGLLAPFLELRQACCHPQIVKGQLISLQKGTMSMEDLLDNLIKKTQLQCHEDHRLVVAALNGMSGLYTILDNYTAAAEKYREVLQSAEKHKEHFQTDSLQLLHAMENLAEILDGNHNGIPFTLRDESLRADAEEVRQKYMQKYANAVQSANNVVKPFTDSVEQIWGQFTMINESWWVAALKAAQKTQKIDNLILSLKQDLLDVTKKNMKNTNTLANKFFDRYGLEIVLIPILEQMGQLRDSVMEGLEELQSNDPKEFVDSAIHCHLRQKSGNYYNDTDGEKRCKLCIYHDNFLIYEGVIFKTDLKNKIDRTGRQFQQRKLLGDLGDELSEKTRNELLQQEVEDLKATTGHVQLINEELRRGTWGDSEMEVILKGILRFVRANRVGEEISENGGVHIKLLEAVKKEFRFLRILWRQIYDQVSALDELSQATTRLIATGENTEALDEPQPGTSYSAKNIKQLRSGIVDRTLKLQTIHVIGFHEIEPKLAQMQVDYATGQDSLAIHLGQLVYLKTLKKNDYGKKGTLNTEDCPICSTQLGKEWSVLRCGHSFCSDCVKKMCPNTLQYFLCPLCRHSMKFADVSFVDTNENVDSSSTAENGESSKRSIEVKGSHSTKVGAVIETLLKLQETHPGEKCILFSTWSNVLDIIAGALRENDIKYSLLNQSGQSFHANLEKFKARDDLQVLLMPLVSGAKGLNIIEATHVLLVEPILNLANELQAIGRVHRIGQTKPTFVHRFYIKRTIEEKLFQILKAQDVSSDEEGSLTVRDLKALVSSAGSDAPGPSVVTL